MPGHRPVSVLCASLVLLAGCGGGGGGASGGNSSAPPLQSLTITPTDSLIQFGDNLQLVATGSYTDGTSSNLSSSATWTTSSSQVASVGSGGKISAVGPGSVTITATYAGVSASTTVNVNGDLAFIYTFQTTPTDAGQPNGPLLQANDGNLYGTGKTGGVNICGPFNDEPCGALFRLTPAGVETVMYSFGTSATDGYWPTAPLIQGADGALYGTTSFGGVFGAGTVFRITLAGDYSVLYSFGATPTDGLVPTGGVIQATDGNFYGTTSSGGANHCANIPTSGSNCGVVFKVTPAGQETVLYSFGAYAGDGDEPMGPVLQASDGALYGVTADGGANTCSSQFPATPYSCGSAFKITLAGTETIVHSFGTSIDDGIAPQGPPIEAADGNFYGTTASGGGVNGRCGGTFGCGTVYRMTPAGDVTILHAFAQGSRSDGDGPAPALIQATDGNLYGTARSGGLAEASDLNGTVFRLTLAGDLTTLYSFGPFTMAPSDPDGGVIQASDGALYGITSEQPAGNGTGTVFKLLLH